MASKCTITYFGHSCFYIETLDRIKILIDPPEPKFNYQPPPKNVDIVLVSHFHAGHSSIHTLQGEYALISAPGERDIGKVHIKGFETFHDTVKGKERGKNTVYFVKTLHFSFVHLGDIGHMLSNDIIRKIKETNIVFIPINEKNVIKHDHINELVTKISPKIIFPMHYDSKEQVEQFLTHVPSYKITIADTNTLMKQKEFFSGEKRVIIFPPPYKKTNIKETTVETLHRNVSEPNVKTLHRNVS
ncbi:MBL fold metallo-hydrolase [Candidatus Margulisiibacteriota bacterium]